MKIHWIVFLSMFTLVSMACGQITREDQDHQSGIPNMENPKKIVKTDAEWRKELSDMEYHVMFEKGTERAFTGEYWDHKEKGIYVCGACGQELFSSETKYDSGSGWPSFYDVMEKEHVETESDRSLFMERTEIHCSRCGAHLGHVFTDGPRPTGLRYCINSASLDFKKK